MPEGNWKQKQLAVVVRMVRMEAKEAKEAAKYSHGVRECFADTCRDCKNGKHLDLYMDIYIYIYIYMDIWMY